MTSGTATRSHSGMPVKNCMPMPLAAIISVLNHLARRGTAPRSRHCTIGGPNRRWFSSQISNAGQPLLAAQADRMRNGTVGTTGSTTPSSPSVRPSTATARHSSTAKRRRSTTRSGAGTGLFWDMGIKSGSGACSDGASSYAKRSNRRQHPSYCRAGDAP